MNTLAHSSDGYIRLWFGTLERLALKHLCSGRDADLALGSDTPAAAPAAVSGYTEWVSEGKPAISVGWDWQALPGTQRPVCVRAGLPRSNVMLVDAQGNDMGPDATSMFLAQWLDRHAARALDRPWQTAVAQECGLL